MEAKDISQACVMLQESTVKYAEIQKLIRNKKDDIVKAKFKYKRVTFVSIMIGFCSGVAASILANAIWEFFINQYIWQR